MIRTANVELIVSLQPAEFQGEKEYRKSALDKKVGTADAERERDCTVRLSVYDIANPAEPRQIGFTPIEGGGIHHLCYKGGQWANASVLLHDFIDYILMTVNVSYPTRPLESGMYCTGYPG